MRVPHDPDGNAWRRAIRATVVVPTLFGLAVLVGSDVVALYVLFGSFTMLVFGDFGGATHHRITAYVATTVAGLGLIVVGTALSESYVAAAIVAFFVAFALTLGAVIGPAVGQLRTPLVLAFVLPASVPGSLSRCRRTAARLDFGGSRKCRCGVAAVPASATSSSS